MHLQWASNLWEAASASVCGKTVENIGFHVPVVWVGQSTERYPDRPSGR
jgi:hypothetical protein